MGLEQRVRRLEARWPTLPRCGRCAGVQVATWDDLREFADQWRAGQRARSCRCPETAPYGALAEPYAAVCAAEVVVEGRVDLEPRIRLLAPAFGVDPDTAIAEAARIIEEECRGV
jgi:hypothetical protein